MSGQQHASAALYPGKDPVPIVQDVGWAPGPVWTGGKSRPHRDSNPDRPARSQSLYRLSYPAHTNILNNIFIRRTIYCSSISYMFQPQQVTITPIQHYVIIFNNFLPLPLVLQPLSGVGRLTAEVYKLHTIRHIHTHTQQGSSERMISPSQWQIPTLYATNTREKHSSHQRDSKSRSQQPSRQSPIS